MPILVFLVLSVLELGPMYATDVTERLQTDRQISDVRQHHCLMPRLGQVSVTNRPPVTSRRGLRQQLIQIRARMEGYLPEPIRHGHGKQQICDRAHPRKISFSEAWSTHLRFELEDRSRRPCIITIDSRRQSGEMVNVTAN